MKKYQYANEDRKLVEADITEIMAFAVNDLLESGVDEDAHYRGWWEELEDEDLQEFLHNDSMIDQMMVRLRPYVVDQLLIALSDRKRESSED